MVDEETLIERLAKLPIGDDPYIKKIAEKFTRSRGRNYLPARSFVIDIHLRLELTMNALITVLLLFGRKDLGFPNKGHENLSASLALIPYYRKLALIEKLEIYSHGTIKIYQKVNTLRNAFTHIRRNIDSSEYKYFGKSIFTRAGIDKLYDDYHKVIKEHIVKVVQIPEVEK